MTLAWQVEVPARVHFGLINLGRIGTRAFGGAGLSLWLSKRTRVTASRSRFPGSSQLRKVQRWSSALPRQVNDDMGDVWLRIDDELPAHVGLGSRTATLLGVVEAACAAASVSPTTEDLIRWTGRAGASGVGVHTYFDGGLVVDGGHPRDHRTSWRPSGATRPTAVPPLVSRTDWPSGWTPLIVRRPHATGLHGAAEVSFFAEHTPVPEAEVTAAAYALALELPAAVKSHDFTGLAWALRRANEVGFKACEVRSQPEVARALRELWAIPGVAAGMSSMGPTVFVAVKHEEAHLRVAELATSHGLTLTSCVPSQGRTLVAGPMPLSARGGQ